MPEYNYSNEAQRWRNADTGRFVSETTVVTEMRHQVTATFDELDNLTTQLYAGNITLPQWQVSVAQTLSDAHLAQGMFAVGGRANMTQANWGRLGGTLASEYRFLDGFAQDIAAGRVSEAQALARIKQYGRATQQSYWREYANTQTTTTDRSNPLRTVPGAGQTQCRGNCQCSLATTAVGWIEWQLNPAEHCPDCLELAANSPYSHIA